MIKKTHIKFGSSFFMLVLLLPVFFAYGSPASSDQNDHLVFSSKFVPAQTLISLAELCEEREAKDSTETLHDTPFIQFTYSLSNTDRSTACVAFHKNPHTSFANTTNLPLYLAKQVFLI
ncbi:MAG: hypothetical protein HYZ44_18190 [Bacteroidetes bacterium]|nr:hypothetical protein [Bacteroidota bacterium]